MKQFKSFGLVVVTLLFSVTMALPQNRTFISLPPEERLQAQEVQLPEPATQQGKLPSAHYSMPCRKLRTSPT